MHDGIELGGRTLASLTIPTKYVPGLAKIISLSDDSMDELLGVLSEVTPSISLKNVSSVVSCRIKSISRSDASKIVRTLVSLYSARDYPDVAESPIGDFVNDVFQAMEQSGRKELIVPKEDQNNVKDRLEKLLSFEAFNVASKALSLQYEHEHTLCSARILTDARPVFGTNPEAAPVAIVISHTLKLTYHEGNELKEIYLAINAEDMEKLQALLDRARSKGRSLSALFDSAKLQVFG